MLERYFKWLNYFFSHRTTKQLVGVLSLRTTCFLLANNLATMLSVLFSADSISALSPPIAVLPSGLLSRVVILVVRVGGGAAPGVIPDAATTLHGCNMKRWGGGAARKTEAGGDVEAAAKLELTALGGTGDDGSSGSMDP